jgi:hypothetical protein
MGSQLIQGGTKLVKGMQLTQPSLDSGVTAHAGGGQANAVQLTETNNIVSTVATTADSVLIPNVLTSNVEVWVTNSGANSLNLFPQVGGNLGSGVNTAYALAAGHTAKFISTGVNLWTRVFTFATT